MYLLKPLVFQPLRTIADHNAKCALTPPPVKNNFISVIMNAI